MTGRLVVDLAADGCVLVSAWPDGNKEPDAPGAPSELVWPLDSEALEDLRWYLEDYLRAPYGVYEDRGPQVEARLARWGEAVFAAVFRSGPARDAYVRMRESSHAFEIVLRSASPRLLGLPWELMRDPARPAALALELAGLNRSLPEQGLPDKFEAAGERLRVLMVISRPAGDADVGYRMIARPLLKRLEAVRGQVDLVVLRPPTLEALEHALLAAAAAGEPFQVVHFDGHGTMAGRRAAGSGASLADGPAGEGVLVFEKPGGGPDRVQASRIAEVLKAGQVPVVVLNACQSGAVGKDVEATVATRLLQEGAASVVAMAYSVYAVAAAEFMATFYERLFAGDPVTLAVSAGRRQLSERDRRPSPRGNMPLADWVVPVHYLRQEVSFAGLRTERASGPTLAEAFDQLGKPSANEGSGALDPVGGSFVGRDALFYKLEVAARLSRVVVLHGPAGTGKTELAKAFGRWRRDTGGVDDQGVIMHSFEPGVASFGLEGVITEVGLQVLGADFARLDTGKRRDTVEQLLCDRRLLLIWDNFETVKSMPDPAAVTNPLDEAGCQELRAFLDGVRDRGRSAVIITSRTDEAWLGRVRRIGVAGLAAHEAAEYAGELLAACPAAAARRATRSFGDLMEWLDGHPLSMRLVLPHLQTTDAGTLLEGLKGTARLPDWSEDDGNGDGGRMASLAASIVYSYGHLSEDTRRLLSAVSLVQSAAHVAALAGFSRAAGVPDRFRDARGPDWKSALEQAAGVGLVTQLGQGMYRLHPALPSYLAAQWRAEEPAKYDSQREAATRAMLTAHSSLGAWCYKQIRTGNAGLAFTFLERERHTLGRLLGYALDHGLWSEAHGIAGSLSEYWDTRGLSEEARAWTDRARAALESPDGAAPALDSPAGALWLFLVGKHANRQMRALHLSEAERTYREVLPILQAQPSSRQRQERLAVPYHQLGLIAQQRGRLDEATDWYAQALPLWEELGDRDNTARGYYQLGRIAEIQGRLDEASDWHARSLAIRQDIGDRLHAAGNYNQLGSIAEQQGRLDEARHWYARSLSIKKELGDRHGAATTYHQLGSLAFGQGRLDQARDWYTKSLGTYEKLGDQHGIATCYVSLGNVAHGRRRLDEAEAWYGRALAIVEELGDQPGMIIPYHQLGIVVQAQGRLDEAAAWYGRALAIEEELGDRPHMAGTYQGLGALAQARRHLDEAEDWYTRSLAIGKELGDRPSIATNYLNLGGLAQTRGRLDEAEDWYARSLAISQDLGDRPRMAASSRRLGLLAEARGQHPMALEWMVRSVALFDEFPHPATGPGPHHLARLTSRSGIELLEERWQAVTGALLPQSVRDYVNSARPSGQPSNNNGDL